jgi:methyl-accepting chemotaxis protein
MDSTVQQNASLIDDAAARTQALKEEAEQLALLVCHSDYLSLVA